MKHYNLLGLGLGPFNLSLAALLQKTDLRVRFLDQKPHFQWHSGLMFDDATMQNSWLKDLVTPADPTSPYSFLNFLVQRGLFYGFVNTDRKSITRLEFQSYCRWVAEKLEDSIGFDHGVREVTFDEGQFHVQTTQGSFTSDHLSLATGLVPKLPECGTKHQGPNVFHAARGNLSSFSAEGKCIVVVGGGQTGIEVFRNCLQGKWGTPSSLKLLTPRPNLQPLDESPFSNEYFTPEYVRSFYNLDKKTKEDVVSAQMLTSDGNTPSYLQLLYNDLYHREFMGVDNFETKIYTSRRLVDMAPAASGYALKVTNELNQRSELLDADAVIFCTGFKSVIPEFLAPIRHLIPTDSNERFFMGQNFDVRWEHAHTNHLFAMNFGRHQIGIAEPQTSLMAWRAATIVNHLTDREIYKQTYRTQGVLDHGH